MRRAFRPHRSPQTLGALLEGGAMPRDKEAVHPRVWEAAVGSRIAERARPYSLKGGVLWVRVSSAAWAQELQLLVVPIRAELRKRGLPVDELRFRVGSIDPLLRPRERQIDTPVPVVLALPPALREQVAAVSDPDLRRAIEDAIGRNLGFQLLGSMRRAADGRAEARVRAEERAKAAERAIAAQGAAAALKATGASRGPRGAATRSDPPAQSPRPPDAGRRGKP